MTGTIGYVELPDGIRLEYEERGDPDGVWTPGSPISWRSTTLN